MKISPLDIRKQSFKKALRGVDADEVRMFLEVVASEYEKILQENAMMAEKLRYQDDRLEEYRELEKSMRNSLVTADRIANESREASEREAGRIVQDAHARGERILEDSRERLQRLVQEVEELRAKKEIYVRRFRTMLESQLAVLQEHEQSFADIDSIEESAHELLDKATGDPWERSAPPRREGGPGAIVSIASAGKRAAAGFPAGASRSGKPEPEDGDQTAHARARAFAAAAGASVGARYGGNTSPDATLPSPSPIPNAVKETAGDGASIPGTGRFFRRSEATLEEDDAEETNAAAPGLEDPESLSGNEGDPGFFSVQERSEGFFELDADPDEEEAGDDGAPHQGNA